MRYPNGYKPTFHLADNILRHLNNPEMKKDRLGNNLLAEPDHQKEQILNHLVDDGFIKYYGDFVASITPKGIKFISDNGYLEQFKINKRDRFKKKYWWLIGSVSFILGVLFTSILEKLLS